MKTKRRFKDRQKSERSPGHISYSEEYWCVKILFALHSLVWLIRMDVVCLHKTELLWFLPKMFGSFFFLQCSQLSGLSS